MVSVEEHPVILAGDLITYIQFSNTHEFLLTDVSTVSTLFPAPEDT